MKFRLLIVAVFLVGIAACAPQAQTPNAAANAPGKLPDKENILIVYLTRTGNTEAVARMIRENVGGDLVSLELENPYPEDYRAIVRQVDEENDRGFLPPLKTKIENIQRYGTVYLGFPT